VSLRVRELPSPNHDERPSGTPIDTLILHYTGMKTAQDAIDRLRDPVARVSAHYVVDEDGAVLRLVPTSGGRGMPGFPSGAATAT
jgi:N-acetylmuramoyl-L-alanine amidase